LLGSVFLAPGRKPAEEAHGYISAPAGESVESRGIRRIGDVIVIELTPDVLEVED
jgi:hypothetical protein